MEIENMTLKQIQQMIKLFEDNCNSQQDNSQQDSSSLLGKYVIIRTYRAGVHFGVLVRYKDTEVELKNAKRIWNWHGANTLHEISLHGVLPRSKISEEIHQIILTQAIEIIPCTQKAILSLRGASWGE